MLFFLDRLRMFLFNMCRHVSGIFGIKIAMRAFVRTFVTVLSLMPLKNHLVEALKATLQTLDRFCRGMAVRMLLHLTFCAASKPALLTLVFLLNPMVCPLMLIQVALQSTSVITLRTFVRFLSRVSPHMTS